MTDAVDGVRPDSVASSDDREAHAAQKIGGAASTDSSEAEARQGVVERYPVAVSGLDAYASLLAGRGIEWGLLGPREADRLWTRHLLNSLALCDVVGWGLEVADVGSGAGLPGIPLALARPDLRITLIEPLLKRSQFLELAVDELGLGERVIVWRGRAEECKQTFDLVTCRAVARLEKLLKWTHGLFADGGELVALKGESAEEEVAAATKILRSKGLAAKVLELRATATSPGTRAIRVHRG